MSTTEKLTVAISTSGTRALSLTRARLPKTTNVKFLIIAQLSKTTLQNCSEIEAHLEQLNAEDDIDVVICETETGVANSRNVALRVAQTELLIFADDDMLFEPQGWTELRQVFFENELVSFLCARLRTPEGSWRKHYGRPGIRPVTRFNSLKVGTPELAVRLKDLRKSRITFDPNFGLNSPNAIGDEYVFLTDCLKAGLAGVHVGVCVGEHPHESSGKALDRRSLAARTKLFDRVFGPWAAAMRLAFAIKHRKRMNSRKLILRFVFAPRSLRGTN